VTDPLPSLLKTGHYRLAAISAARTLCTTVSPADAPAIFELLQIRLACLCLLNEHAMAAQEAKLLGDLSSAFYRHPLSGAHIVPWELRVLSVRLAALGYGDWRKGIMGYYELAREARENVVKAETEVEKKLWRSRLRECGIRVANVLVEMGELEGAGRHLGTLISAGGDSQESREVLVMEALVWLRVGDLRASRRCIGQASALSSPGGEQTMELNNKVEGTLNALLKIAEGDYNAAVEAWTELHTAYEDDAMVTQNLAVSLLYTGKVSEARNLLTDLAGTTPPFHALTFNLSTMYELCTERSRDRKLVLAERVAAREPSEVGWEMVAADFKL
jgi:tetratricopeptide (TPR) repeat protein